MCILERSEQNGDHFADDIFKCIKHLNDYFLISINIYLKINTKDSIDNKSAFVQANAWCLTDDKLPVPILTQIYDIIWHY